MYATFWSLVPPIVAIALALITKEVYSSLFVGIVVGGLFFSGFSFEGTLVHIFQDGMIAQLSDSYNVGILVFLVFLGIMVALMNKAGGSAAFGEWASKKITSRVGAQLATILLGCLIFIDDYFNCLTVGSVMRPVTDRHQVSRAKLAYLIDATAAPVCIIAPISSWAAAVSAFSPEGTNGLVLFIKAIPYNYYALLTILMMVTITILKIDYGPMARHEKNALAGNIFTDMEAQVSDEDAIKGSGKVIDLVLPIEDCMACLTEGFKAMVPAIMILVLAWTLKSMTDSLGAKDYVAAIVSNSAGALQNFLPAIVFLIAVGLSFATGTSWGTFGILIPICLASFPLESGNPLAVICVSACMAGAVCGDHCSPISDTTIMSSAGAMCDHIAHVSTQMPYALTAAAISFVAYVIAGFVQNAVICLIIGVVITIGCMFFLHYGMKNRDTEAA